MFFQAFERPDGTFETRHKPIAIKYLKLWFNIDFFSSLPFQLLELMPKDSGQGNLNWTAHSKWMRIFRLAKLQRMIRLLRLLKLVRLLKQSKSMRNIQKLFQSMNSQARQLVGIFIGILFATHLVGCFWFLLAKEMGFPRDCWVSRAGIIDADISMQYLQSLYWAFQTLTTVGFGDINGKNMQERLFAIMWMLIGIGFYSIMFGNMTNLLDSMDAANKSFQEKISVLKEFRKRTNIHQRLFTKIKRHLETNQKSANNFHD
jgi:hyperpolarization activated cyclic nucleotide-gated potassium channel 1